MLKTRLTDFEVVIKKAEASKKGLLSKICKIFDKVSIGKEMNYQKEWKKICQKDLIEEDWQMIWSKGEFASSVMTTKLQTFKILAFWYTAPKFLSNVNKKLSPHCWKQ